MWRRVISLSVLLLDAVIIGIAPYISLWVRFDGEFNPRYYAMVTEHIGTFIVVFLATQYFFGFYHRLWRYAGVRELLIITVSITVSTITVFGYLSYLGIWWPRSIYLLSWILCIALIGCSRIFIRVLRTVRYRNNGQGNRVLIVGAGDAGAMIAREIQNRYYQSKKLVGFIDDDPYKKHQMLFGVKVLGTHDDIPQIVEVNEIKEIIIAIPSMDGSALRKILEICSKTSCTIKTVPGLYELIDGKVTVQQLRNVDLEDLLRRDPIQLDLDQITGYLTGKRVLITGAGGSIGSELCRQIAKLGPDTLVLLGKGENSIYEIDRELREKHADLKIEPIIADVRDITRINNIFTQYQPQVVFHAAAHKHVPLMESQPEEAVRNNIFGTRTVAEAADRVNAEIFVLISTDKAVNPTSVMGATKRVAEMTIQSMNSISPTKYAAVRFGNVLGSRGSVIPHFKRQIAKGGPITITHPDMKRYFMTIPEATQLVLQAGAMAKGGEVFVLDMGEPVKIVDMAHDLIRLSGLEPGQDIEIKFTGLRPGEKLFEELLTAEEGTTSTKHEKIYVANLKTVNEYQFQKNLQALQSLKSHEEIIGVLMTIVPSYKMAKQKYTDPGTGKQPQGNISMADLAYKIS